MNTQTKRRLSFATGAGLPTLLLLVAGAQSVGRVPIGPGSPSGSTEKKDPRIPISMLPFTITECGSYYLTECLTGNSSQGGITINADNVTLDLNGFSLLGLPGSKNGVLTSAQDIAIFNGSISGWGKNGIRALGHGLRLADLRVDGNAESGILVNGDTLIYDCSTVDNEFYGISLSSSGSRTLIESCVASGNNFGGISITGSGGIVMSCSVSNNENGITANSGSGYLVSDNVCSFNALRGINLCAGNLIKGNICNNQGNQSGTGEAIRVRCGGNFVKENLLVDNDTGIITLGSPDIVVRNCASEGLNNYAIGAGADAGPVGKAAFATSPWANIDD